MRNRSIYVFLFATLVASIGYGAETRPFYMGFTTWPYDATTTAVNDTWQKIHEHADMVCLHVDGGVPWNEAYAGTPYHANVLAELNDMESRLQSDEKLYLAVAPLNSGRSGLADYWGAGHNMARTGIFASADLDDAIVVQAYTNYCLYMIDRFNPDFFNYGIEGSELAVNNPYEWPKFVTFVTQVYPALKTAHPDLPIFISMPLRHPYDPTQDYVNSAVAEILDYTDYAGISVYPYLFFGVSDPAEMPTNWLSQVQAFAPGKPIAIAETGYIAEDLSAPTWSIYRTGTPEWQNDYVAMLLNEANNLELAFVTWFSIIDFDNLNATFPPDVQELGGLWRDTGLYDGDVVARPSLTTWDAWLAKPIAEGEGEGEGETEETSWAGLPGVPTASDWGLFAMGMMVVAFSFRPIRKRAAAHRRYVL